MHAIKTSFLIIFIAIMNVGGCVGDDDSGCDQSCRGLTLGGCPTSEEECKCVANRRACDYSSFNEEKRKCSIFNCVDCSFFGLGRCPQRETTQQDITLSESEFVTVFPLGGACDVISSTDSENDCDKLTMDRECESFEFIQKEDDNFLDECWLYDCQQCLLESLIIDEEVVK